jgi:hypothetical protein
VETAKGTPYFVECDSNLARLSPQSVANSAKGQLADKNWLPHLDVPRYLRLSVILTYVPASRNSFRQSGFIDFDCENSEAEKGEFG